MLEVRGVTTFYGAIQALHGVDLDVGQGEIVTLIGANGAGKSTLLMTICGNPRARSGSVRLEGDDITQLPTHEIVQRGVVEVLNKQVPAAPTGEEPRWEPFSGEEQVVLGDLAGLKDGQEVQVPRKP